MNAYFSSTSSLNGIQAGGTRAGMIRSLLILVLTATLFFALYQHHRFRGLTDSAAMEHAQLGRALAEGRGYHTRMLRPIAMGTLARRHPNTAIEGDLPELGQPPLYPLALGAGFRLMQPDFNVQPHARAFAPETRVILPLGWLFTLATAILIFMVGSRFFDRRIAAWAPLVYLLSHTVLERVLSGLPDPMSAFLGAAAFSVGLAGIRLPTPSTATMLRAPAAAGGAGILAGLAILSDYTLILFMPAPLIACTLAAPRRRGLVIGLFAIGLVAVITPWLLRNIQISGHPFGLAQLGWFRGSPTFPGNRLDRSLSWNPEVLQLGSLLRARFLDGLSRANWISRWVTSGEALFPTLALAAFCMPGMPRSYRFLRWPLLAASVCLLVFDPVLATGTPGRLLYPLFPWIVLLGCAAMIGLLDRTVGDWPLIRQTVCAAVLLLHATPTIASLLSPRPPPPYPPLYPPFVAAASALVENDELMVADIPWATAWYGNQRTLWLPNTLDEFYAVNDYHQTVAALYLTPETTGRAYVGDLLDGDHRDWLPFVEGQLPAGFPLTDGLQLPVGKQDQIVLIGPGRIVPALSVE